MKKIKEPGLAGIANYNQDDLPTLKALSRWIANEIKEWQKAKARIDKKIKNFKK